jgi:hypothetical protein
MKKFISAVTSLAMTATMASVAAPAAINAADSTKTLTIAAYAQSGSAYATQGSAVTISKDDIAAGDVKVPCAVYLTEGTADTQTMSIPLTIDSDQADVANVKFDLIDPNKDYFDTAKAPYDVKNAVVFASEYDEMDGYLPTGTAQLTCEPKQDAASAKNYYIGFGELFPRGYSWTGDKSDDYPVFVFDVTFPKGTAEGTYNIHFCDYVKDDKGNPSLMLETDDRYTTKAGNLKTQEMTITIGDGQASGTTTTSATTTTVTTLDSTVSTTSTTVTDGPVIVTPEIPSVNADADVVFDLGTYTANAGDKVTVDVLLKKGSVAVASMDVKFKIDSALKLAAIGKKSAAYGNASVESNLDTAQASFISLSGSEPIVGTEGDSVFKVQVEVPAGTPDGNYYISFANADIFKSGGDSSVWDYGYVGGVITVGDVTPGGSTTTTSDTTTSSTTTSVTTSDTTTSSTTTSVTTSDTTTSTTTTSDPGTSTTTSTTTTGVPGSKIWGDANCDGTVNVADVVVLNKYLHDASSYNLTEQGKINADCCNPKDGAELTAADSKAIIQSIVHLVTLPVQG